LLYVVDVCHGFATRGTVVVMADPQVTTTAEHPRGAMLRAYDKTTGKEVGVGAVFVPAPQRRIADDLHGRRQSSISSWRSAAGAASGQYVAFTLPN
jgi:quinoprotein glucose dehydrogenase